MDRKAVDLLLSTSSRRPSATIAGAVLSDHYGKQAGPLIAAKLLERRGHELATTSMADHDDAPVSVTWSADHDGYGYFNPSVGWVTVPNERLAVFGVSFPILLAQMVVQLDVVSRSGATTLVPELLWEIGDARFGGALIRVPIMVRSPTLRAGCLEAGQGRSRPAGTADALRVLLTSTPRAPARRAASGHLIVSVRDVIDYDAGLAVRPDVLGCPPRRRASVPDVGRIWHLSPSGQQLIINGTVTIDFKADIHIADRAQARPEASRTAKPICLTAAICWKKLNADMRNTLAKAFRDAALARFHQAGSGNLKLHRTASGVSSRRRISLCFS